jgi:hypothetical protein
MLLDSGMGTLQGRTSTRRLRRAIANLSLVVGAALPVACGGQATGAEATATGGQQHTTGGSSAAGTGGAGTGGGSMAGGAGGTSPGGGTGGVGAGSAGDGGAGGELGTIPCGDETCIKGQSYCYTYYTYVPGTGGAEGVYSPYPTSCATFDSCTTCDCYWCSYVASCVTDEEGIVTSIVCLGS